MASCFVEVLIETRRFHSDEDSCQALNQVLFCKASMPRDACNWWVFWHGYPKLPLNSIEC